jgi:autotransporter passenger strand-loop-strand repeat protein
MAKTGNALVWIVSDPDSWSDNLAPIGGFVLPLPNPPPADGPATGGTGAATGGTNVTIPMTVGEGQLLSFTIPAALYGTLINPTITWNTANGTASANVDYVPNGGTSFTIAVQTLDDLTAGEPNEVFYVNAAITGSVSGVVVTDNIQYVVTIDESGLYVSSGTSQTVSSGQVDSGGTIQSGGSVTVNAGGTISNTINNGGVDLVYGSALATTVDSGGQQQLFAGATASGTIVNGGGSEEFAFTGGISDFPTINSGGFEEVGFVNSSFNDLGGTVNDATVNAGGAMIVYAGGVTNDAQIAGREKVENGGVANDTTVSAGGTMDVTSGGVVNFLVEAVGAVLNIFEGTANASEFDGTANLNNGGVANNAQVKGTANVNSGGVANFTVCLSGSTLTAGPGARCNNTVVDNAGLARLLAGCDVRNTTIDPGGTLTCQLGDGSTAARVVVQTSQVSLGAVQTQNQTIRDRIQRGTVGVVGQPFGEPIASGATGAGATTALPTPAAELDIYSGGASLEIALTSGGFEFVNSGGVTSATIIYAGGYEIVGLGTASDTVIAGGLLELQAGASAGTDPIDFIGTGGTLQIDGTAMPPTNMIRRFVPGNTIDLTGATFASGGSATLQAGNVLQIVEKGVTYFLHLDPHANYAGATFHVAQDAGTGTAVTVTGTVIAPIVANDFLGDGVSDLMWRNGNSGEIDSWVMLGGQMIDGAALGTLSSVWRFAGYGNLTGLGLGDAVWQNTSTGDVDSWLMNNDQIAGGTVIGHAASVWQPLGTGDFNRDDTSDLLWRNGTTGEVDTWLINNGVLSSATVLGGVSSAWRFAGVGDINGDGTSDALWHNAATGAVESWLITNGHVTGGGGVGNASSAWQALGTGDFNNDGTSDILWRNVNTGEVDTWILNNGHMVGGAALGSVSSAWQFAGIGDYTGSGTSDVIWRNNNSGEVDTWLITNDRLTGGGVVSFASTAWQPQVIATG